MNHKAKSADPNEPKIDLMHSPNWQATLRSAFLATVFIVMNGEATAPLLAQSPLRVITQPPNAIRASSALLNGMVLPGSNPAAVWFEWSTSAQYGNVTELTNVVSGEPRYRSPSRFERLEP